MKMKSVLYILVCGLLILIMGINPSLANDHGHDHENEDDKLSHKAEEANDESKHDHAAKQAHDNESNHEHGDEDDHEHEEESEAKNVGPEKGVTLFDEEKGFILSKEALKTFSVLSVVLQGPAPWNIPGSALLLSGGEKNVYRLRNGFFKRVDILILSRSSTSVVVRSAELSSGDQVVIQGVGNIRLAELDVTSGEVGHSH